MLGRSAITAAVLAACAPASAQELRLGYLSTLTGPFAGIGGHNEKGWKLGLAKEGWTKDGDKLGGVPTRIFYGDDQQRTDAGVKEAEKLLKQDKVHILAGIIWSNVLMAVQKPTFDNKTILISTNAGASPMAGASCNPLFTSTSWNNDQVPEAMGKIGLNTDGVGTTWLAGSFDPARPLDPRIGAMIQDVLDAGYRDFTSKVAAAREQDVGAIDAVARGRVWSGAQAKDHGLVDAFGGLDAAVADAAARAW